MGAYFRERSRKTLITCNADVSKDRCKLKAGSVHERTIGSIPWYPANDRPLCESEVAP
jgi:hypothetical protein